MEMFNRFKRHLFRNIGIIAVAMLISLGTFWYFDVLLYGILLLVVIFISIIVIYFITRTTIGSAARTIQSVKKSFVEYEKLFNEKLNWDKIVVERERYQTGENTFEDFIGIIATIKNVGREVVIIFNMTTNDVWRFFHRPLPEQLKDPFYKFSPLQIVKGLQVKKPEEKPPTVKQYIGSVPSAESTSKTFLKKKGEEE